MRVKRRRRRRGVTSSAPRNLLRSQSDVWSVKCVSAPSAPRGAPFCQVNPISNELMRKTGMSLRRGQPQSPSVLHWLVQTYYQACLTFLRQCPGVPLWHLGCSGVRVFSVAYICISDGAAAAVALGADTPEFRPVFLALHLILLGVFFWRDTQWTLMSPCAGVFAQLWNSALLVWKYLLFFFSLCLVLAGIAGNWLQWRWLEPGPLCPFRVGHANCFY